MEESRKFEWVFTVDFIGKTKKRGVTIHETRTLSLGTLAETEDEARDEVRRQFERGSNVVEVVAISLTEVNAEW